MLLFLARAAIIGLAVGGLASLPARGRNFAILLIALLTGLSLLSDELLNIFALPDALAITAAFALAYGVLWRWGGRLGTLPRIAAGALLGIALALALWPVIESGGLERGGILRGAEKMPYILSQAQESLPAYFFYFALLGALGALAQAAPPDAHNGSLLFPRRPCSSSAF